MNYSPLHSAPCRCRRKIRKFSVLGHLDLHLRERRKQISENWTSLLIKMERIYVCICRYTDVQNSSFVSLRAEGMVNGKARDLSLIILLHVLKFKLHERNIYLKKKKTSEFSTKYSISIVRGALPLTYTQSSSRKYIVFL